MELNNGLKICFCLYKPGTNGVNTADLPISFDEFFIPITSTAGDFADSYITTMSIFAYNLSQVQVVNGGWTTTTYDTPCYIICIGN